MLKGTWSMGTSKCGEMKSYQENDACNPFKYPMPSLGLLSILNFFRKNFKIFQQFWNFFLELVDPGKVVSLAREEVKNIKI